MVGQGPGGIDVQTSASQASGSWWAVCLGSFRDKLSYNSLLKVLRALDLAGGSDWWQDFPSTRVMFPCGLQGSESPNHEHSSRANLPLWMCARDSKVIWCMQEFQALKKSPFLVTTWQGMGENIHEEYLEKSELEIFLFILFSRVFFGGAVWVFERGGGAGVSGIQAKHSTVD